MPELAEQALDAAAPDLTGLPARQQPGWRRHPAWHRTVRTLEAADALVTLDDVRRLRSGLAEVAEGRARVLQAGDCAESFRECVPAGIDGRLDALERLGQSFEDRTGQPILRVGRLGGQFAKPRSSATEVVGGVELPTFRGHLVNSEVASRAARTPDPRRMLWAYEASARVLDRIAERQAGEVAVRGPHRGPWSSHEALVVDYESALVRVDPATGERFLASTHLPWIGERTRQPDHAHVRLLAAVHNPVGCKVGPEVRLEELLELCRLLDRDRVPGRLALITRLGAGRVQDVLPALVRAVRRAGHPVVWLCDPMHGNTVTTSSGLKTRRLDDVVAEAVRFRQVLQRSGAHDGGLHLETAAEPVTECLGGRVQHERQLRHRYTTLCDPRLAPDQAEELVRRACGQR